MSLFLVIFFAVCTTTVFNESTLFARLRGQSVAPDGELVPRARAAEKPGIGRLLRDLLGCPLCVGTWVGFAWSAALYAPAGWWHYWQWGATVFGCGVATGAIALAVKLGFDVCDRWG